MDKDEGEQPKKKKEMELIDDWDKLIATYTFENERYQHTINRDYENILPARANLLGDGTPNRPGWIVELKRHLGMSKISDMTIGQNMLNIMKEIGYLANIDTSHIELLEAHAEHYQFICRSAIEMMERLYIENEELKKKIMSMEIKKEEKEAEIDMGPPITEKRRMELITNYEICPSSFDFAKLVNPKQLGKNLTGREIEFLKEYNRTRQKFKGSYGKERSAEEPAGPESKPPEDKAGENRDLTESYPDTTKDQSEPLTYSPLSHKPEKKEPLYSEENPQ